MAQKTGKSVFFYGVGFLVRIYVKKVGEKNINVKLYFIFKYTPTLVSASWLVNKSG